MGTPNIKPKIDTSYTDDVVDDNGDSIVAHHDDVVDDQGRPIKPTTAAAVHAVAPTSGGSGSWDDPAIPQQADAAAEPKSVMGFLANIPRSAGQLASGLWTMAAHPLDTIKNTDRLVAGGEQALAQKVGIRPADHPTAFGTADETPIFDAFLASLAARYGGVKAIGNTLYSDPVGSALDASALLSGGATAVESRLPATARYLRLASETIDPLRAATKAIGGAGKLAASTGTQVLGKSTGVGVDAIRVAANASDHPQFVKAMRGGIEHVEVLDQVHSALSELADRRRQAYQAQLAKLPQGFTLDVQPVRNAMKVALKDFNISVTAGPSGPVLDFSRSSLRHIGAETGKVQAMFDDLMQWGSRPDDLTPLGLDRLKQGLTEMVAVAPGRGDVVVKRVADAARDVLVDGVPGYKQMTSDYAKASQFLDEVNAELSVKPGTATGAGIRKIATALNQRSDYRRMLIDVMDAQLGTDIKGAIAGLEMRSAMPRGIIGPMALGAGGMELLPRLSGLVHDPAALASALAGASAFSPRLVGEVLAGISNARASRVAGAVGGAAKGAARITFDPKTYRFASTVNAAGDGNGDGNGDSQTQTPSNVLDWLHSGALAKPPSLAPPPPIMRDFAGHATGRAPAELQGYRSGWGPVGSDLRRYKVEPSDEDGVTPSTSNGTSTSTSTSADVTPGQPGPTLSMVLPDHLRYGRSMPVATPMDIVGGRVWENDTDKSQRGEWGGIHQELLKAEKDGATPAGFGAEPAAAGIPPPPPVDDGGDDEALDSKRVQLETDKEGVITRNSKWIPADVLKAYNNAEQRMADIINGDVKGDEDAAVTTWRKTLEQAYAAVVKAQPDQAIAEQPAATSPTAPASAPTSAQELNALEQIRGIMSGGSGAEPVDEEVTFSKFFQMYVNDPATLRRTTPKVYDYFKRRIFKGKEYASREE